MFSVAAMTLFLVAKDRANLNQNSVQLKKLKVLKKVVEGVEGVTTGEI